jgi:hypothetical protein
VDKMAPKVSMEKRNYILDRQKAVTKKLRSLKHKHLTITWKEPIGKCCIIDLDTKTFELCLSHMLQRYSDQSWTTVVEQSGVKTEDKVLISHNGAKVVHITLYKTGNKIMVQGLYTIQWVEDELPAIVRDLDIDCSQIQQNLAYIMGKDCVHATDGSSTTLDSPLVHGLLTENMSTPSAILPPSPLVPGKAICQSPGASPVTSRVSTSTPKVKVPTTRRRVANSKKASAKSNSLENGVDVNTLALSIHTLEHRLKVMDDTYMKHYKQLEEKLKDTTVQHKHFIADDTRYLKERIVSLENDILNLRKEHKTKDGQITSLQQRYTNMQRKQTELTEEVSALKVNLTVLQDMADASNKDADRQKATNFGASNNIRPAVKEVAIPINNPFDALSDVSDDISLVTVDSWREDKQHPADCEKSDTKFSNLTSDLKPSADRSDTPFSRSTGGHLLSHTKSSESKSHRREETGDYDVQIVGTSIVRDINQRKLYSSREVRVKTLPYQQKTIRGASTFLDSMRSEPRVLLYQVGSNDLSERSSANVLSDTKALILKTKQKFPNTNIVVSALLPRWLANPTDDVVFEKKRQSFNREIERHCIEHGHAFVKRTLDRKDTTDGIHLQHSGIVKLVHSYKTTLNDLLGLTPYQQYDRFQSTNREHRPSQHHEDGYQPGGRNINRRPTNRHQTNARRDNRWHPWGGDHFLTDEQSFPGLPTDRPMLHPFRDALANSNRNSSKQNGHVDSANSEQPHRDVANVLSNVCDLLAAMSAQYSKK